jgi:hypothetical protein
MKGDTARIADVPSPLMQNTVSTVEKDLIN